MADRDPIDRVLDVAMFAPIGTAIVVRDTAKLTTKVGLRLAGRLAGTVATRSLDVLTRDADESIPPPSDPDSGAVAECDPPTDAVDASTDYELDIDSDADSHIELPIEGYDHLAARQVVARLADLTTDELEAVAGYEAEHRNRQTILGRVRQLRDV